MEAARAIVPAAGLATRLLPLTRALPKALLPLGDKPVIDRVIAELRGADVQEILVVTGHAAEALEAHLAGAPGVSCVRQGPVYGLGAAVLAGREFAAGGRVVVALGDALVSSEAVRRLRAADAAAAIAVEEVADPSRYGVVVPAPDGRIAGLVEKPALADAPSRLAVAGRYVIGPEVFDALERARPDGELGLTDALDAVARSGARVVAVPLAQGERRIDVGDLSSYAQAWRLIDA